MGHAQEADTLYRKSVALVDEMIQHAATTNIERYLLAEMSDVYSGYFASLSAQKHYDQALQVLEKVRGRIETACHCETPFSLADSRALLAPS